MKLLRRAFTMIEVMMVVAIISVIFAISTPALVKARERARGTACVRNLRLIDAAKEQYGLDNRLSAGATISGFSVLCGAGTATYLKATPVCPSGGSYNIDVLGTNPSCGVGNLSPFPHVLP